MRDLFGHEPYPDSPGYKEHTTSHAAAEAMHIRAGSLRGRVLAALHRRNLTTDECARDLNESVLAIRPRFSELSEKGLIKRSGEQRLNASGKWAIVWQRVKVDEILSTRPGCIP